MRLFIAINFPAEIKSAISEVCSNLKKMSLSGNFTLIENLHLTLLFLDECNHQQTESIKLILNETIFQEFTLTLDKAGYFKRNDGDTWWIGLKESQPLSALQADLSMCLKQQGFVMENRKFTPHITIGRKIRVRSSVVQPLIPDVGFNVASIELMKSEHIKGKLTYTPIYSRNAG